MSYETIKIETEGPVAILTVSRPKAMNALNDLAFTELSSAIIELEDDDTTRVVIVTGEGEKAFVAGADIVELQKANSIGARLISEKGQRVFAQIEYSDLIFIAAINGFALGGGCEFAMSCDIRLAAESAKMGQPEINLGIIPGYAGTQRLPRLIGRGKAMEMLLTGDMIDAKRAKELGVVEEVYPSAELMSEARKLAEKIASKAPHSVAAIKRCVVHGLNAPLSAGSALEASEFSAVFATEDKMEGTTAFLERRKPEFKGK